MPDEINVPGAEPKPSPEPKPPLEPTQYTVTPLIEESPAGSQPQPQMDWEKRYLDTQAAYTRSQQELGEIRRQMDQVQASIFQQQQQQQTAPDDDFASRPTDDLVTLKDLRSMQDNLSRQFAQAMQMAMTPVADAVGGMATESLTSPFQGSPHVGELQDRMQQQLQRLDPLARANPQAVKLVRDAVVGQMVMEGKNPYRPQGSPARPTASSASPEAFTPENSMVPPESTERFHDPLIFNAPEDFEAAAKYQRARMQQGLDGGKSLQQAHNESMRERRG